MHPRLLFCNCIWGWIFILAWDVFACGTQWSHHCHVLLPLVAHTSACSLKATPCRVLARDFHVLMKKSGPSYGQGFPRILFLLSASGVVTVSRGAVVLARPQDAAVLSSFSLSLQPGLGLPHFWDLRRKLLSSFCIKLGP